MSVDRYFTQYGNEEKNLGVDYAGILERYYSDEKLRVELDTYWTARVQGRENHSEPFDAWVREMERLNKISPEKATNAERDKLAYFIVSRGGVYNIMKPIFTNWLMRYPTGKQIFSLLWYLECNGGGSLSILLWTLDNIEDTRKNIEGMKAFWRAVVEGGKLYSNGKDDPRDIVVVLSYFHRGKGALMHPEVIATLIQSINDRLDKEPIAELEKAEIDDLASCIRGYIEAVRDSVPIVPGLQRAILGFGERILKIRQLQFDKQRAVFLREQADLGKSILDLSQVAPTIPFEREM